MILSIGIILNQFLVLNILPIIIKKSKILKRITILIQIIAIYGSLDWINIIKENEILLMDGIILMTKNNLSLSILIMLISIIYLQTIMTKNQGKCDEITAGENELIIQTNILGIIQLIHSNDWIILLISWEIFNISLYLLFSLNSKMEEAALAATLKYFLLSALSTSLFLLGLFFYYIYTGSTQLDSILLFQLYSNAEIGTTSLIQIGGILIISSLLLKIAVAPLHNYAIDLYGVLPLKITMYMMIIPKIGVQLLLNRLITLGLKADYLILIAVISSLVIGSISLISQIKIKEFLGFSGVSNIGIILITIYCNDNKTFIIYILIYFLTVMLIFQIQLIIKKQNQNIIFISQLAGLFKLNPYLSLSFTLAVLSLAGCPPFLGFFAKYYVIESLINSKLIGLAILLFITSTVACYRYLTMISVAQLTSQQNQVSQSKEITQINSLIISIISCILLFGWI